MVVKSAPDFRRFLTQYQADILFPFELPAIHEAYWYALRGAARELIALDQQIAQDIKLGDFAVASRSVGCRHLKQLRTLRDQRLVQRYLHAVESGAAHGWHTVVYGVILAVYSIPLRQGLMQYGELTLRGFVQAAGRSLRLDAAQRARWLEQSSRELARATEAVITRPPRAI